MVMELDKRSAEDLSQTRPGYDVIFMKVAEGDVRSIEFWPSINGTLRTALPSLSEGLSEDLHEWIDNQHQESQEKGKEEASK